MLTPKQEHFCRCIVSGMTAKDSYMTAYNCNGKARTAYNEGNKLLKRSDVTKRIEELMIPVKNHAVNTAISEREKKKAIIWTEIEHARAEQDHAAIARYMDILNKMDSEYINISRVEQDTTPLNDIDTQTLIKLVK